MMNKPLRSFSDLRETASGGAAQLLTWALAAIRRNPRNHDAAARALQAELKASAERAGVVLPPVIAAFIEQAAHPFVGFVSDTHLIRDGGGGHASGETQKAIAPAVPHSEAGEGQKLAETHLGGASPASEPQADDGGQLRGDTHTSSAVVVREPSREDWTIAGRIRKEEARTIFDSTELRGRPLRRIAVGELRHMRSLNVYDNHLIDLILEHAGSADPLMLIPDVLKESTLELLKQKAAEMTDAV